MRRYIARRLLLLIPTLVGLSLAAFLLIHLVPGDPVKIMLYPKASPEAVARLRAQLGLDRPLWVQYWRWLTSALRFDFGISVKNLEPVGAQFLARFPATIELSVMGLSFAVLVGVPLGVISAVRKGSATDYASMLMAILGASMPVFWFGMVLVWVFSICLGWFPVSGRVTLTQSGTFATEFYLFEALLRGKFHQVVDCLAHIAFPAICVATWPLAVITRMTRSSMLEVLGEDYIRTARSKGLTERVVVFRHALRNALIPVITVIGLSFGMLLGGTVVTETVFAWPGIGSLLVKAISLRDYPVIQAGILIVSVLFMLVNLAVDVLYSVIDPRIRYD